MENGLTKMKKILMVEDEIMNIALGKHALSDKYEVTSATSGEEALQFLEEEIPDMLLLDIGLPGIDGLEVARIIKEDERFKEIPIVFLTADTEPETEAKCLEMGADDFIIKPFVPIVMQRRIGRIFELRDLRDALEVQLVQKQKQIDDVTRISITDSLTGVFNRSYIEHKITELISENHVGTMFIMDIDNFKKVNDTLGHIAGDKTLQLFADILRENTRRIDVVGRLGGDEFVIFFMDMTTREIALEKARSIINTFWEKFRNTYALEEVSISIGIASCPTDGKTFEALYKNADKALYYIKNKGKNSYHFFEDEKNGYFELCSTTVDLNNVRDMIEGNTDMKKGAFQVSYGEFRNIYDFVLRCVERKQQMVQTVLLTLCVKDETEFLLEEVEKAMRDLQMAIKDSLRAVDVGTEYSSRQYVLLLMDADTTSGMMVVERVIRKFYENYGQDKIELTYDIQTMRPGIK